MLERLRVDGRAEVRRERGVPDRGAQTPVDRLQAVVALAAEAVLREDLALSGRVNFARTVGTEQLEQRLLEGSTGVSWRPGPFLLVARYSVTRELLPGPRNAFGERMLQVLSLMPTVRVEIGSPWRPESTRGARAWATRACGDGRERCGPRCEWLEGWKPPWRLHGAPRRARVSP